MSSQWHMQTTSCGCFHSFCSWLEWPMVYSFLFNIFTAEVQFGREKRQNMLKIVVFMLCWFFGEQIFPPFLLVLLINGKNVARYMISYFSLVLTLKAQSRWKFTLLAWITLLSKMFGHFLSVSLSAKFFPNKVAFSLQLFDNECVYILGWFDWSSYLKNDHNIIIMRVDVCMVQEDWLLFLFALATSTSCYWF